MEGDQGGLEGGREGGRKYNKQVYIQGIHVYTCALKEVFINWF